MMYGQSHKIGKPNNSSHCEQVNRVGSKKTRQNQLGDKPQYV